MNHLYESNRYLLHSKFRPYSIVIFFPLIARIVFILRYYYYYYYYYYYFTMQFQLHRFYAIELHDRMVTNGR
jgi:hypothetical protein